ncbi:MAG: ferritin-like domain-containing protein [Acidimicrobiia bacterium]|nr:ferritin-like domain-containing protein [Acidimicrobiia bacterium]
MTPTYTLAPTGTGRPNAVLDLPDRQFPRSIGETVGPIRELYRRSKQREWNAATAVDWAAFDPSSYTDDQLFAARQYWSRRAWGEYGAISESPAMAIRYQMERREPDLVFFWTMRTHEEVRHAEVCQRMADACGGYLTEPVTKALEGSVATHGVRSMSFDADTPLEALVASLICCAEVIAFDVFVALIKITTDPVAKQVLKLIMRDEVRHCDFGWKYLEYRVPDMTAAEIDVCRAKVIWMIEEIELKGYHSSWLSEAPDLAEIEADRLVYEAGLGATVEEIERPLMIESIGRIRERMAPLGIELPMFDHPKIGQGF